VNEFIRRFFKTCGNDFVTVEKDHYSSAFVASLSSRGYGTFENRSMILQIQLLSLFLHRYHHT